MKFISFVGLFIAITTIATSILLFIFTKQYLINEAQNDRMNLVENLKIVSTESALADDYFFLLNYAISIKKDNKSIVYALFINNENRILAHTNPELLRKFVNDPVSIKAQLSNETVTQLYETVMESGKSEEIIDVSLPVFLDGKRAGTARIGFSKLITDRIINSAFKRIYKRIFIMILVVSVFGFLCTYYIIEMPVGILTIQRRAYLVSLIKLKLKILIFNYFTRRRSRYYRFKKY